MATLARVFDTLSLARARRLSRSARFGLGLLTLHVLLLFVPPIPPYWKGSLWSYVIGYVAILLLVRELARSRFDVLERWRNIEAPRRRRIGAACVAATLAGTLALRAVAPEVFGRFAREEGLWEPLTLFCFLGSLVLVWSVRNQTSAADRKPWRLVVGLYLLLVLEEIDYFGIFGGIIGRIDGIYAGSLHDIIRLTSEGVLSGAAIVLILGIAIAVFGVLWRLGYFAPAWLGARLAERELLWFVLGFAFLFAAGAEEAHLFGWVAANPTPEEAIELVGSVCLGIYALELASMVLAATALPGTAR